jgi:hypothetical protein
MVSNPYGVSQEEVMMMRNRQDNKKWKELHYRLKSIETDLGNIKEKLKILLDMQDNF